MTKLVSCVRAAVVLVNGRIQSAGQMFDTPTLLDLIVSLVSLRVSEKYSECIMDNSC